jgi:hypothetical protein
MIHFFDDMEEGGDEDVALPDGADEVGDDVSGEEDAEDDA